MTPLIFRVISRRFRPYLEKGCIALWVIQVLHFNQLDRFYKGGHRHQDNTGVAGLRESCAYEISFTIDAVNVLPEGLSKTRRMA